MLTSVQPSSICIPDYTPYHEALNNFKWDQNDEVSSQKYANETSTSERINAATEADKFLARRIAKKISGGVSEEVTDSRNATLLFGIKEIQLLSNLALSTRSHQIAELEKTLEKLTCAKEMILNDPTKVQIVLRIQKDIDSTNREIANLSS